MSHAYQYGGDFGSVKPLNPFLEIISNTQISADLMEWFLRVMANPKANKRPHDTETSSAHSKSPSILSSASSTLSKAATSVKKVTKKVVGKIKNQVKRRRHSALSVPSDDVSDPVELTDNNSDARSTQEDDMTQEVRDQKETSSNSLVISDLFFF
ncbi:hypothetical protein K435DRAFT_804939 [Dendrothele bispora CBS 962.96]|uniref:Uncharacterized protein n=1 Tax=Dendrothele bispora (strain CBS 962.96) TaxID=1314807 RepID=A0A4S8LD59_DENBC|nr:hypothetical protein K435DRAFT_804939 [Dendrothele bispora CBS 962.96]